jgi:integrase
MPNALSKDPQTIFPPNADIMRKSFQRQRKLVAFKLQNPRLMQISFHALRHYKATMEYHKTKNILHILHLPGHKNIKNTLVYTQLIQFKDDDYVCKAATTVDQAKSLIEAGFEYICEIEGTRLFRKRK